MTQPNSNGGIYVMTEFQEKGWPSKGFEIQVNNTYKDPVKTGSLYHVTDIFEAPAKDDEWFTEHIIVKGDTITVMVNGKQTVEWTQPADWDGGREGPGRASRPRHDRAPGPRPGQHGATTRTSASSRWTDEVASRECSIEPVS